MNGMRTDISYTLFLSDPKTYSGGELVLENTSGDESFKLPAGAMIVYPTTALHHVAKVTRGERLVCVGWARSYVRDAAKREILFDLDTARRRIFAAQGASGDYNLVAKSAANLMRMWAED
jgi:PKHD-type hydroxylase